MTDTLKFPPGKMLNLSRGCFSDFCYESTVVTLKDCDLQKLAEEHGRTFVVPKNRWQKHPDPSSFAAWLVVNGHCAPVDIQEVHLGEYDDLDLGSGRIYAPEASE